MHLFLCSQTNVPCCRRETRWLWQILQRCPRCIASSSLTLLSTVPNPSLLHSASPPLNCHHPASVVIFGRLYRIVLIMTVCRALVVSPATCNSLHNKTHLQLLPNSWFKYVNGVAVQIHAFVLVSVSLLEICNRTRVSLL